MSAKDIFFAGGGTGGHIYPALAIAEKLAEISPQSKLHFFVSERAIDSQILSSTGFEATTLPARGLSFRPVKLTQFICSFLKSKAIATALLAQSANPIIVATGSFVAAPVALAARKLGIPVKLINIDSVPGRANKLIARWADEIFVQFERTAAKFAGYKAKVTVTGCPLRSGFENPQPGIAIEQLALDKDKKLLLITGASLGSQHINDTICSLLSQLDAYADKWQIVHLTGRADFDRTKKRYADTKISHKVLAWYDDMADLLSAADLCIGRSGAVSVAEYCAASVASICIPYPHHRDRHQYLNADELVRAGAAVVVDDLADETARAQWLWEELKELLNNDAELREMAIAAKSVSNPGAAETIAKRINDELRSSNNESMMNNE